MKQRSLSLFDLICLGLNGIVGSGIYLLPGTLAALLGPASVLGFVLAGLVALLIAFSFAELAGRFDRSGGPYLYANAAFDPFIGYLVGWTCWSASVLSWAAVTRGLVTHLAELVPLLGQPVGRGTAMLGILFVLAAINVRGVKPGAITTNVLTVAKLAPLLLLLVLGVPQISVDRIVPFAPLGYGGLIKAAFIAFFAYQGFEVVAVPAGESQDPQRNAPRALLGALLAGIVLYMLLQLAAVGTTPNLAGSAKPMALMAQALLGQVGGSFTAIAAAISMLGFCAGAALVSPRFLQALADDGHVPPALGALHERFATPHRAIWATTAPTALVTLFFDFAWLVNLSVIFVAVAYLSATRAVMVLRGRSDLPMGYRQPFGPLLPVLASVAIVGMVGTRLLELDGLQLLAQVGVLYGVGVALWLVGRRYRQG